MNSEKHLNPKRIGTRIVLRILLQKFESNIVHTQMWWPFICKLGLKRSYENRIFTRPAATAAHCFFSKLACKLRIHNYKNFCLGLNRKQEKLLNTSFLLLFFDFRSWLLRTFRPDKVEASMWWTHQEKLSRRRCIACLAARARSAGQPYGP